MSRTALLSGEVRARRYFYLLALLAGLIPIIAVCYLWSSRLIAAVGSNASFAQQEFARLFDLWGEGNVPAWYTSFLWILCAYFALKLSRRVATSQRHKWKALGVLFIYMSFDEVAGIHESAGRVVSQLTGPGAGIFTYTWVYLGISAVALTVVLFARFVLSLPKDVLALFLLGGTLFVGGALVLEMVQAGSNSGSLTLPENLSAGRLGIVEELAEMLGITVAMAGLTRMLDRVQAAPAAMAAIPPANWQH
jgi:hypothetical protein